MTEPSREGGRGPGERRKVEISLDVLPHAEGSCLITTGGTRVLCSASVEEDLPKWRKGAGKGWVTGEYAMLPRATHTRRDRERRGAGGRTREIERLIGRSLRSVTDMAALGPRTVIVDCDVLAADGGTRTASVTGGFVALALAVARLREEALVEDPVLVEPVAAVSVGLVGGTPMVDLDYREDSAAQVDMNVVATASGRLVEVQGTAEGAPFTREALDALLDLALGGIQGLVTAQREALGGR